MADMTFKANLYPDSTSFGYNLGSSTNRWKIYGDQYQEFSLIEGEDENTIPAHIVNLIDEGYHSGWFGCMDAEGKGCPTENGDTWYCIWWTKTLIGSRVFLIASPYGTNTFYKGQCWGNNATSMPTWDELTTKTWSNNSYVTLSTAQTITGAKTFTQPIYFETGSNTSRVVLGYNASYPNHGITYSEGNPDVMTLSASGNANNLTNADLSINGLGDGKVSIRGNEILHLGNYASYLDLRYVKLPNPATDNAVVRFDGTSGAMQNSTTTINDNGTMNIKGKLVVNPSYDTATNSHNEGVRINRGSNNWAIIALGAAADSASGVADGEWLIGRRGAAGSKAGAIGDLTLEEQDSSGAGLTLHKDSGGATLYADKAADAGCFNIKNNASIAASRTTWAVNALTPNMAAGASTVLLVGQANSTKNQAYIGFHYEASNSNNNYLKLGLYAADDLVMIHGDGTVKVKTGSVWVQGGSNAGGNVNRMTLTSGMPTGLQYNSSQRGTRIFANAIALADPYNGNSNNDSGWLRHIEETGNSGILELAVGDDGNEQIVARQYNTSSAVLREAYLLNSSGATTFPVSVTAPVFVIKNGTANLSAANNGSDSTLYNSLWGDDKDGRRWFCVEGYTSSNGNVAAFLGVRNYNTSGTAQSWKGITITETKANVLTYTVSDPDKFRDAISVPSRTGAGASGTWGISISGNAATATTATTATYCTYLKNQSPSGVTVTTSSWTWNPLNITNYTRLWGQSSKNTSVSSDTADMSLYTGGSYQYWLTIDGGVCALDRLYGTKVLGAVWNDYAEYRETKDEIEPGRCVHEVGDGTLILSTKRLQRGCEIISDTFGFAIGESDKCKTPTATAGRVLAYLYEDNEYAKDYIGWPVCSGPNGTISIMTEEEEMQYPSRIIGTISEVPNYDIWHAGSQGQNKSEEIKVNGRIWIRIR